MASSGQACCLPHAKYTFGKISRASKLRRVNLPWHLWITVTQLEPWDPHCPCLRHMCNLHRPCLFALLLRGDPSRHEPRLLFLNESLLVDSRGKKGTWRAWKSGKGTYGLDSGKCDLQSVDKFQTHLREGLEREARWVGAHISYCFHSKAIWLLVVDLRFYTRCSIDLALWLLLQSSWHQ